jgi:hypothetical protein
MGLFDLIGTNGTNSGNKKITEKTDTITKSSDTLNAKKEEPVKKELSAKPVAPKIRPSPAREFLGNEIYAIDCRGANLYIHEAAVVIDKTGGGLWNLGDNNIKIIPFRSIIAIQAKLKSTVLTGYIEFETANSPLSVGSDKAERSSENSVILSGSDESYEQAKDAIKFVLAHIL